MSEEHVEVVRRWFERLAAGDPAPELCHPEIELRNWAQMPTPGPYYGHDGVREWWADVTDSDITSETQPFDLQDVLVVDDECCVTVQRARGRMRYTGIEGGFLWGSIICVRDGKIASASGYPTPEAAKEAAGLEE